MLTKKCPSETSTTASYCCSETRLQIHNTRVTGKRTLKKKYLLELHTFSIIHYSEVLLVIIKLVQREWSALDKSKYCIKVFKLNISGCCVLLCTERLLSDFLDNFGSWFIFYLLILFLPNSQHLNGKLKSIKMVY